MNLTISATEFPAASADSRVFAPTRAAARECMLADSERQRCEVWTRVMGYHRPVSSFNVGKQAEHAERRFFELTACAPR